MLQTGAPDTWTSTYALRLPPDLMPIMFDTDTVFAGPMTMAVLFCVYVDCNWAFVIVIPTGPVRISELIVELPFGVRFVYTARNVGPVV